MKSNKLFMGLGFLALALTVGATSVSAAYNNNEAVMEAVESGNYTAWVEAVGEDCQMLEKINADNFPKLTEAHDLMQGGREKMQQAREIREELGMKFKNRYKKFGNGRFGQNNR